MEEQRIKITRNLKIGALDAEADSDLLSKCFVDNGYLSLLTNTENPASIVLGRTGAGKSALLYKIEQTTQKSTKLDPNDISIRFLENSDIIQFFEELGINLDLFYRLLWRHILTVELLKLRYDIKSEIESRNFLDGIFNAFGRDPTKRKAIEYFNAWSDKFWLDTSEHLQQITQKLEKDTQASIGAQFTGLDLSLDGAKRLSEETRTEIKQRASQVVNGLQIKKLNEMLDLLAEHSFTDPQKKYYILIDQLDEDWASTETRCHFIRALIEEIKTLRKIRQLKIIAALRKDLIELVFDKTRDSGFQEEKYESYLLDIRWSPEDLARLIGLRINEVFKSQYTKEIISFEHIFPKPRKGGGQTSLDFIIERSLRRPRDVLQFVNECFNIAYDRERISWRALFAAEAQYSVKRLKSLKEEWGDIYPCFEDTIEILRGLKATFTRSLIKDSKLEETLIILYERKNHDPCSIAANKYYDGKGLKESDVLNTIFSCLYKVGALGIKTGSTDTFIWSYIDQSSVSRGELKRAENMKIHKMLHRSLDVAAEHHEIFDHENID
ncbi:P-loop ATPase, Sll1717 family [Stutzerimonas balearica]|uniref:P-loop ATPase, Sll1717 family n=1 Tax=Stutzerimonas balearica TaxID=74829 RepID=UPI00289662A7|nr:DNA repair protein [Stutzerimonas balearica]